MKELNDEIKLTINLMQTDIDDGAHGELQSHLYSLLEMKRELLGERACTDTPITPYWPADADERIDVIGQIGNDRGYWLKSAQTAFNAYIRKRDEHFPCISCQRHHSGQYHAGHYRSVGGNPELRFVAAAAEQVVAISDRQHEAWDALKSLIDVTKGGDA